jgi:lysophospholipase L1-like esterase
VGRRGHVIAFVVAAAFPIAACVAPTASGTAGDGTLSILVMGDSYSAGNGGGSYALAPYVKCWRSAHNYGREFERIVEAAPYRQRATVRTVACSGDTTTEFANSKNGRPPQLNAVNASYDLIFLTIGGNDLHFSSIVRHCLIRATRNGDACRSQLSEAEQMLADGTLAGRLGKVLAAIQANADPTATIVLLGYPYLEADASYSLGSSLGTFEVGKRLRRLEDTGDALEQAVVNAVAKPGLAGLVFVKTKALFAGHELYAGRTHRTTGRWLTHPLDTPKITFWYHPNPTGWRHEAELLAANPNVPKRDP